MKKRTLAIAMTAAAAMALSACGGSSTATTTAAATEAAATDAEATEDTTVETEEVEATTAADASSPAAPGEEAGFEEFPVINADGDYFQDVEVGFLNVSAVYFQPVPMSGGNESIEGFDIHLEADVSALENDLGFGTGDWVPYMTVDYEITTEDGTTVQEGSFMPMSASDGPHYGANISLPEDGVYNLTFVFHNPEEQGYILHTDAETGPGGSFDTYFADGNLEVKFEGWEYFAQEW